jgi:uncharacterized protein with HEPN domain
MPSRNWQLRVQDILQAIVDIHDFTNSLDVDDFPIQFFIISEF